VLLQSSTPYADHAALLADVRSAVAAPGSARAYVEVHIEQGPVLESSGVPLGVVTAIAGQTRLSVSIAGEQGHAGTVPMTVRRDALAGAAEAIVAIERRCQSACAAAGVCGRYGNCADLRLPHLSAFALHAHRL
jgi:acetylornithine deacetylase/succinyl-diaminopimelate desuccinylase-like protein